MPLLKLKIAAIALFSAIFVTAAALASTSPTPPVSPAQSSNSAPAPLIIGTGAVTGIYFPAAGAVQRVVNDQTPGLRLAVESTNGSVSNLQSLLKGGLDLAVAQSDWSYYAVKGGLNPFLTPNGDLRVILALHAELLAIIVKEDSDIKDIDGLKGRRINLGPSGSGPRTIMTSLFQILNWSLNELGSVTDIPFAEQSAALCDGRVDAIVFLVPHPNAAVQEALARCHGRLLPVSGRAVDTLVSGNPFYGKNPIPGSSYSGTSADIPSFGVRALLMTTTRLPDETAYAIAKAVMSNSAALSGLHPSLARLTATDMKADSFGIPLHPGVAKYLSETGATAAAPRP